MDLYGMRGVFKFLSNIDGVDVQGKLSPRAIFVSKIGGHYGDLSELRLSVIGTPVRCWASIVKGTYGGWVLCHSTRRVMRLSKESNVYLSEGELKLLPDRFVAMDANSDDLEMWVKRYNDKGIEVYRF